MIGFLLAAAIAWSTGPVDQAWARLAADAKAHDAAAFKADRDLIARLDGEVLSRWGAKVRETYGSRGYGVVTYDGPTRVRGERSHSAYFAVVTPSDDFSPPTLWEVTPGFSPAGGSVWNLRVSGCDLAAGNPLSGYPEHWRTAGLEAPPAYDDFKAKLSAVVASGREFPSNTYTAHTPGTACLYVGDLTTEHLTGDPPPRPSEIR